LQKEDFRLQIENRSNAVSIWNRKSEICDPGVWRGQRPYSLPYLQPPL